MNYLLDTDVASQATKTKPDAATLAWLGRTDPERCFISAMTLFEIGFGIELMPPGRRRSELHVWLHEKVPTRFQGRILAVSAEVALDASVLMAREKRNGFNLEVKDVLLAASARIHGLEVATLNRKHFERLGVALVSF